MFRILFQFVLLFSDHPDISESFVVSLWMCCFANSVGDMSWMSCMKGVEYGHIKAKGATRRPSSELKMEDIKVF